MADRNQFEGSQTLADLEEAYEAAHETAREESSHSDPYDHYFLLNSIEDDYYERKKELQQ